MNSNVSVLNHTLLTLPFFVSGPWEGRTLLGRNFLALRDPVPLSQGSQVALHLQRALLSGPDHPALFTNHCIVLLNL